MLCPRVTNLLFARNVWKFVRYQPPLVATENEESPYVVGPYIRDQKPEQSMHQVRIRYDDVYEEFYNTDFDPKPNIKVILLESVGALGIRGEVLDVECSRARYHLLMSQKAAYASPKNLELYKDLIENSKLSPDAPSSRISLVTREKLRKTFVLVTMNRFNPWTIEPWHVRVAFRLQNIKVPDYAIKLPDTPITGPDLDKQYKDFAVQVTINKNPKETVWVRCVLNHSHKRINEQWHRLQPRVAILPEQQELLDGMHQNEPYIGGERNVELFGSSIFDVETTNVDTTSTNVDNTSTNVDTVSTDNNTK